MVLRYLEVFLGWPVVVLVLGMAVLILFREELRAYLRRLEDLEGYGIRARAPLPALQLQAVKEGIEPTPEDQLQRLVTENPQQTLELFRRLYNSYTFERAFNSIFGSQVELLEHLEAKGDEGDKYVNLTKFFQAFVLRGGDISKTQFADYIGFLTSTGLVEYADGDDGQIVRITPHGVDFLSYLRTSYPAGYRFRIL